MMKVHGIGLKVRCENRHVQDLQTIVHNSKLPGGIA